MWREVRAVFQPTTHEESFVILVLTSFGEHQSPGQPRTILINPLHVVNYVECNLGVM
jgi:hypothetical protein